MHETSRRVWSWDFSATHQTIKVKEFMDTLNTALELQKNGLSPKSDEGDWQGTDAGRMP